MTKAASAPAAKSAVTCRVLKAGDGRISTGEHTPGEGDRTYARGDVFQASAETAAELEARGLVEAQ